MISEKLETMHVDINEGFRKHTEKYEQDAHIITLNEKMHTVS